MQVGSGEGFRDRDRGTGDDVSVCLPSDKHNPWKGGSAEDEKGEGRGRGGGGGGGGGGGEEELGLGLWRIPMSMGRTVTGCQVQLGGRNARMREEREESKVEERILGSRGCWRNYW